MTWLSLANWSLPWPALSWPRMIVSEPSTIPQFCSLGVPLSELALDSAASDSLRLSDLVGLPRGEFVGGADTGEGRGC